jgi:DNA-binding beta-propeller fold protein YncE
MKYLGWSLTVLVAAAATAAVAAMQTQEKGGTDEYGPYKPTENWIKPVRPGYVERGASVFAESPNRIIFTSDLEFPVKPPPSGDPKTAGLVPAPPGPPQPTSSDQHHFVMIVDAQGNVVDEWKQWDYLFRCPHEVQISPYDPEKNVWIADRDNSQVFEFSHDGKKLLLTMGEKGVIANDDVHFGRPSNISFTPDGSYYVSDGYANTRIIKFNKNNKRILTWGSEGSGHGQFRVQVHDVAVDQQGRVYVADRGNDRVQIFDSNGKYLDEWDNIYKPSYIYITKDNYVWVLAGQLARLLKYDKNGHLLTYWGTAGPNDGMLSDPHGMSMDSDGNLYIANYSNYGTQTIGIVKFVPKPDADKSRLVSPGFNRFLPATSAPLSMTH